MIEVVIGRVGRAHGLRGEVNVEPRTDEPELRFALGASLRPDVDGSARLTVRAVRAHGDRLVVGFTEVSDRNAAEALSGALLLAEVSGRGRPADPEEYYDHQLVGLAVRTTGGDLVGRVAGVLHSPGQDVLVVAREGGEVMVPFVAALVPSVDLDTGTVTVDDRPGLLADPIGG